MTKQQIISFPHMGDYHIPIGGFFQRVFPDAEIRSAPPITAKTAALGERHSPDFICAPFKFNMGNFIETLDEGATILLQTGTGCRYGYYGELQEQILRDLGYDPTFLCLSRGHVRPDRVYHSLRNLGSPRSLPQMAHALWITFEQIRAMDKIAGFIRQHAPFARNPQAMRDIYAAFLKTLPHADSIPKVHTLKRQAIRHLHQIPLDIPKNPLRVGIVGDLYTVMEPFGNADIERKLAAQGIQVSRAMSVTFLLTPHTTKRALRQARGYVKHHIGANGVDSVAQSLTYAKAGYDGILHLKSFGCTPELNAAPAMQNISRDYEIPILSMSFDTHHGDVGVNTRLEAFIDMIAMKRRRRNANIQLGD